MEALRPALRPALRSARPYRPLYPCLHTDALRRAAPPPATAASEPSDAMARVARKRRQADVMKQAREMRDVYAPAHQPKNTLARRFWKDVHVREANDGLQVLLDHRPVRMPNQQILTLPPTKQPLATAIALEWDLLTSAQQALHADNIPMTSLAARALDLAAADTDGRAHVRAAVVDYLMRVLSTDTLLCWAPETVRHDATQDGQTLRERQRDVAMQVTAYLSAHVWPGIVLQPTLDPSSILPVAQPTATQYAVRSWCEELPAFELAGLERAVLASKSLLVGARLVHEWGEAFAQARPAASASEPRFGVDEAAAAATLEVQWQTAQWGEVEDTHDVEREDLRRQLGSAIVLVGGVLL